MLFFKDLTHKRVAVGLFGMHFKKSYKHWMGWVTNVDWRKTNYNGTVLKALVENKNHVDHYFSTYHTECEKDLLNWFNPKKHIFCEFDEKECSVTARHKRFKETLGLFEGGYDYYLITRFDLNFSLEYLLRCEVEESSINVTSRHGIGEERNLLCDNFYVFANENLERFRSFIDGIPPDSCNIDYYHRLDRYENAPKFSCMLEGSYYSHNCPLWGVLRN